MNPSIEVYVATHKPIDFALPDYCKKIQVNAEANGQWPGYLHDNDNPDNISLKNPNYCELTALYSMWKNCKADIQGLCHYRRYFSGIDTPQKSTIVIPVPNLLQSAVSEHQIIASLEDTDVIVSLPYAPYPLNAFEDLRKFVYLKDIRIMRGVIHEYYPNYSESLEHIFSLKHISYCNMFIARRNFVDDYCTWLFDVLGKMEGRVSLNSYDTDHKRIYGYLAEVLLNVYIHKNNLRCKYFQLINPFVMSRAEYYTKNVKNMLKKVPGLQMIFDMLIPARKRRRLRLERRYEDMLRFLAGEKTESTWKITDASGLREYISAKIPYKTDRHEDSRLICGFADMRYEKYKLIIAVFLLKNDTDIHSFCEKMKAIVSSKEEQYTDTSVVPEVICNGGISDEAREALMEAGATIVEP